MDDGCEPRSVIPPQRGAGLWIGILGPLVIMLDGAELPVRPAAQRAVLGMLALAHGSSMRRDSVIDVLWGEQPPDTAAAILQTHISRLRSVLDSAGKRGRFHLPVSDGSGYRLRVSDGELDVAEFRQWVREARQARSEGDTLQACTLFEQALSLWRGDPLANVAALRRHPLLTALADEQVTAILEFADVAASCGSHERVLPHVRTLTARDPLDEASHARLMTALAGSGRQGEALKAYEELRKRLDEQLGVLPGPGLRDTHARILRQEVRGQTRIEGGAEAWTPVFQLPAALADFTGRAAESARLVSALCPAGSQPGVPLVAISGPPGIGKTTMALYAAHKVRAQFPDGQLWVQLAGASGRPRDPGDVLGELLRALGTPGSAIPDAWTERAVCYRSRMAGRRVLVIADDAVSAAQVSPLLPGTAGCAMVVTSRARLEGLDGAHLLPLDVLSAEDAASLLTRIIGPQRVAVEPDAAGELVHACGALPLAVRITAAKLAARPSWPLSAMVRRITNERDRLRELEAGDLSVRASIASSYESLPERLRRAFCLLALLGPADFAEWVAGALLGDPAGDQEEQADVIGELVGRSLLSPLGLDATDEPRYRLHDLLREFAAARLDDEPAIMKSTALGRLLQGWLQLAQLADSRLPPDPYFPLAAAAPSPVIVPPAEAERLTADPIAWFATERVNLLTAVEQAGHAGRLGLARQLGSHQCAFQHLQHRHDDAERVWQMIAQHVDQSADHQVAAAYARLRISASMIERGRAADAQPILDQSAEVFAEAGELETLAFAQYWRAVCAWDLDQFEGSRDHAARGIAVARQARSRLAELMNLREVGNALAWMGSADQAIEANESALAIALELGVPSYESAALHSLALTYTLTGRHDRAVAVCHRRIEVSQSIGDIRGVAVALGILGDAYRGLARYEESVSSLLRALPIFRDRGSNAYRHYAVCLLKLGFGYEAMGCYSLAIDCLDEAKLIFGGLRLPHRVLQAQQALDRCRALSASAS